MDGALQRYVYVELKPLADADGVEATIVNDPFFLDEQTLVFAVPSVAALEKNDHGVMLERHAAPGETSHAAFLLEARHDEAGPTRKCARPATASMTSSRPAM